MTAGSPTTGPPAPPTPPSFCWSSSPAWPCPGTPGRDRVPFAALPPPPHQQHEHPQAALDRLELAVAGVVGRPAPPRRVVSVTHWDDEHPADVVVDYPSAWNPDAKACRT